LYLVHTRTQSTDALNGSQHCFRTPFGNRSVVTVAAVVPVTLTTNVTDSVTQLCPRSKQIKQYYLLLTEVTMNRLKKVITYSPGLLIAASMITCMYVGAIIYTCRLRPAAKQPKHSWNS